MTIAQRHSRSIEVNGIKYSWKVHYLHGWVSLVIQDNESKYTYENQETFFSSMEQITPSYVRKLIISQIEPRRRFCDWKPSKKDLLRYKKCNHEEIVNDIWFKVIQRKSWMVHFVTVGPNRMYGTIIGPGLKNCEKGDRDFSISYKNRPMLIKEAYITLSLHYEKLKAKTKK